MDNFAGIPENYMKSAFEGMDQRIEAHVRQGLEILQLNTLKIIPKWLLPWVQPVISGHLMSEFDQARKEF